MNPILLLALILGGGLYCFVVIGFWALGNPPSCFQSSGQQGL